MAKKSSKHVGKSTVQGTKKHYRTPKKKSWYKKPRQKKVKPPEPVRPEKPERPRRSELRKIYRDIHTTDAGQRIEVYKKAFNWFERCEQYVGYRLVEKISKEKKIKWYQIDNPWTIPQLRTKNALERAKHAAITIPDDEGKEKKYQKAIEYYEKLVNGFHPPSLSIVLKKYSQQRSKLELRRRKFRNKFGEFMDLLQKVLQPKNPKGDRIELRVDKIKDKFSIDSHGNVTFDRRFISEIRRITRKRGLLSGVLQVLPMLRKAAALVPKLDEDGHKTGQWVTSRAKALDAGDEMMYSLVQYSLLDPKPKKLIRRFKPRKPKAVEGAKLAAN